MAEEFLEKRMLNSKTFRNPDGSFMHRAHCGHCHYRNKTTGKLEDIDTTLIDKGTFFEMRKAGYEVELPKKSNGAIKFLANNEEIDFVHLKVDGQSIKVVDGILTKSNQITYPEVLPNIDLRLSAGNNSFRKEIVIKQKPIFVGDFYKIEFFQNSPFVGIEKSRNFKIGEIYFRPAKALDSEGKGIDIELSFQANKMIKRIPKAFLENAVYPVITDTVGSYYTGAGDGYASQGSYTTWAATHDAASGDDASYAAANSWVGVIHDGTYYAIRRFFYPIDTSALPDDATITAATLNLYIAGSLLNQDNDGDDWLNVVGPTTQASTASLVTADFDQCGAVNNPTEGATRIDLGNITQNAYNTWTLNATGRGWISLTGWTQLGLREGHDALNLVIASSAYNRAWIDWSEQTGTTQDPYLEVTYTVPVATRSPSGGAAYGAPMFY